MVQYLLALHEADEDQLSEGEMRQCWADVNALADKMKDAGTFVFKSGLLPNVSHRGLPVTRRIPDYRWPVYLDEGAPCRVLEFDVAGLDEALELGRARRGRGEAADRGPAVSEEDLDDAIGCAASDAQWALRPRPDRGRAGRV